MHLAVHTSGQLAGHAQAQARARATGSGLPALKIGKDPFLLFRPQTWARVRHGQDAAQPVPFRLGAHVHLHAAQFRKFHRIADQVAQSLTQAKAVARHGLGQVRGRLQAQEKAFGLGHRTVKGQAFLQTGPQIEGDFPQGGRSLFQSGVVRDVADHFQQGPARLGQVVQGAVFFRRAQVRTAQKLCHAQHGRKRGAHVVAQTGPAGRF